MFIWSNIYCAFAVMGW